MAKVNDAGEESEGTSADIAMAINDAEGYTKTFIGQEDDLRYTLSLLSEAFEKGGNAVELTSSQDAGHGAAIFFDEETATAYANEEAMRALAIAELEVLIKQQELTTSELASTLAEQSRKLDEAETRHLANAAAIAIEVETTNGLIADSETMAARYKALLDSLENDSSGFKSFSNGANSAAGNSTSIVNCYSCPHRYGNK